MSTPPDAGKTSPAVSIAAAYAGPPAGPAAQPPVSNAGLPVKNPPFKISGLRQPHRGNKGPSLADEEDAAEISHAAGAASRAASPQGGTLLGAGASWLGASPPGSDEEGDLPGTGGSSPRSLSAECAGGSLAQPGGEGPPLSSAAAVSGSSSTVPPELSGLIAASPRLVSIAVSNEGQEAPDEEQAEGEEEEGEEGGGEGGVSPSPARTSPVLYEFDADGLLHI